MSSKRRRFSGELKAKVALEALRGDRTFGSEDDGRKTIPIDRARSAGLDYLALGD